MVLEHKEKRWEGDRKGRKDGKKVGDVLISGLTTLCDSDIG